MARQPQELNPPDCRPLQDSELVDAERRNAVQRAIGTLPEKYRAPLILRDVDGRSYDEIAKILGDERGNGEVANQPGERVPARERCGLFIGEI
jgi:DNA-directed RNA polymerase specialized sigma24 family protein